MNLNALLVKLIERPGSNNGEPVFITAEELEEWPESFLHAIKTAGLIKPGPPAKSAVCPGCEEMCTMPVDILRNKHGTTAAFVTCDKRDDVNRVYVPLNVVDQWVISVHSLALSLADLLQLPAGQLIQTDSNSWSLGTFNGNKHSRTLVLSTSSGAKLWASKHMLDLKEILFFEDTKLRLDIEKLKDVVDLPVSNQKINPREHSKHSHKNQTSKQTEVGTPQWREETARNAANVRHSQPGGSREKQDQMRAIWATGKYSSRDRCAEEECAGLGISFSTARKALRNTPDPT